MSVDVRPPARARTGRSGRPLYLHFLDRELLEAVGAHLTPQLLDRTLATLTLGTDASLYCGISVIWEHTLLSDDSRRILEMLVANGVINPVSYSSTVEEFLESRMQLYSHDAARYPAYFDQGIEVIRAILPTDYKWERTTDHLEESLGGWAFSKVGRDGDAGQVARSHALHALMRRDTQAITFAYFAPFMRRDGVQHRDAEGVLSRQISVAYADHYLKFSDGDIPTGVAGLPFFDATLAVEFPLYDVRLLARLLRALGLGPYLGRSMLEHVDDWHVLFDLRGLGVHARVVGLLRVLLSVAMSCIGPTGAGPNLLALRSRVWSFLRPHLRPEAAVPPRPLVLEARLGVAEDHLLAAVNRLSRDPQLADRVEGSRRLLMDYRADVLLVTATEVETRAVLDRFRREHGETPRRHHVGDKTYFDMGSVAGARTYLVQTEIGSGGPSGSTLTVVDAIAALSPSSVVLVGIAFGVDASRTRLGDVLVSRQVLSYDLQRVGTGAGDTRVVLRGDRVSASPRLLDRCRSAALEWRRCGVHFGLMVSGDKLIDNVDFRDRLVAQAGGEVMGGEMEGAGLYASAHRRKVDWIVVKAICDWADGMKDVRLVERQATAAANAAAFVSHVLSAGGLA